MSEKHLQFFVLIMATFAVVITLTGTTQSAQVARYEFEGNLDDASGNGHTGTIVDNAMIVDDPQRGMVIDIPDGTSLVNIHSTVPIPAFAPQTSITLAAWIKRMDTENIGDNFRYAINLGANGDNPIVTLGVGGNDTIISYIETDQPGGNLDQVNVFGSTRIEPGVDPWEHWHHLAVVHDRSTDLAHTYLDGSLDNTVSISLLDDTFSQTWGMAGVGKGSSGALVSRIDEATIYDNALTEQEIVDLMGVPVLAATVDRSTGGLTLSNVSSLSADITGYAIRSDFGGANSVDWLSVADNYDEGGSVDDGAWSVLSDPNDRTELAEQADSGDATLAMGQMVDLGTPWIQSPVEDLVLEIQFADGSVLTPPVRFTGGPNNAPFERSDLNFDGMVDEDDWPLFYPHTLADLSALSGAEQYQRGDLDGDGDNDVNDFTLFKDDFDLVNGAGAFNAMLAGVPEPSSILLVLIAGTAAFMFGRRRVSKVAAIALLAVMGFHGQTMSVFAVPADFTTFTVEAYPSMGGFPDPMWTLTPTTATLNNNAYANVLYSPESALNKRFVGSLTPGTDDDVVGFVFGFNPGDAANAAFGDTADYILLDWKGVDQEFDFADGDPINFFHDTTTGGPMPVGLALSRVTDGPTADELWQHIDDANNPLGGVEQLARGASLGSTPYNRSNGSHTFDITYTEDNITVSVDGVEQFNISGSFPDGRFGLYSAWQGPPPTFSNFEILDANLEGLTAQVDRSNGEITLQNNDPTAVEFDYYQFTSASNSLNVAGWNSLADQDFQSVGSEEGQSWVEAGGSHSGEIGELFLRSISALGSNESVSIGSAYNNGVNGEDLVLTYRLPSGLTVEGPVSYINEPPMHLPGDFAGDGAVEGADLSLLLGNWGADVATVPAAWDGDPPTAPFVDGDDLSRLLGNWGNTTGAGASIAAVPEPASFGLVLCLAALLAARYRVAPRR